MALRWWHVIIFVGGEDALDDVARSAVSRDDRRAVFTLLLRLSLNVQTEIRLAPLGILTMTLETSIGKDGQDVA